MGSKERNTAAVLALFAAWDAGQVGYDEFLAEACVYETAGFPVLRGKAAIMHFLFSGGMQAVADRYGNPRLIEIRRLQAEILHIVAQGNVVVTERVDHHFTSSGEEVLTPRIAGVMEFDDAGRCTGWRDYHDPAYFRGEPSPRWPDGEPTALAP